MEFSPKEKLNNTDATGIIFLVKDLLYNDDRADLAEIINNYGPADIDLHGRTGAISITGVLAESEQ